MKRALILLACALLAAPALRAADDATSAAPNAAAGGISISPDSGQVTPGDVITISFPRPMVAAGRIDMGGQPCPFTAVPKLDGTFLWKSETDGEFTVSGVVAGATHHCTLAPGLTDADGHPFSVPDWSADYSAPTFAITTDAEFRSHLPAQPRIPLTSTYDVLLADVATHAWIQDRDSRAHLPIEVIQTTDGPPEAEEFQIQPRDPLPAGHTYDLIIEGLQDSRSKQPLPYPAVFPLGDTQALDVDWVGGFNQALATPMIAIKFNDSIPPDSLKAGMIQLIPDVTNFECQANGDEVDISGDFDLKQRYHVIISNALVGESGYALPAESRWFASFPPRQPAISFPGPRLYLRSRQQLHFAFLQSHTPAVTWNLASVPLEKLPAVDKRLDEYNETEKDPLTGKDIYDPKTDQSKQKQTELLVSAFNLPVVLTGTCEASNNVVSDQLRDVTAPLPAGTTLAGPYIIEASSQLPDGRIAGGRALVVFSDTILTQKRSPSQVFMRVAKMSDAMPVSGVTVRAVTDENIELARAVTDSRGIAVFSKPVILPVQKPGVFLFIADTTGGPSLAFADESTYPAGDSAPMRNANHCVLITDRNLYRPGEEVKIKGLLRDESSSGLAIPPAGDIHWQIVQGEEGKVVADGTTSLSDEGSFEASWQIPASAALGNCTLTCTLNGNSYSGSSTFDIEEYRVPLFSAEVDAATETGTTAHMQVLSVFFHGGANAGARVHWKAAWTAAAESGTETLRYNAFPQVGPVLDPNNELSQTIEGDAKLDANGQASISCDSPFAANPAVGPSSIIWNADITSIDGQTLSAGASENFASAPVLLGVYAEEQVTAPRGLAVTLDAVDPDNNAIDPSDAVKVTADLYSVTTKTVKEQVAPMVFRYHNTDEYAKIDSRAAVAPGTLLFSATTPGNYVVAVHARDIKTPIVSFEATITGDQEAEVPVENNTSFGLTTRKEPWLPGDKAAFVVESPFAGVAWVCVETDDILDTIVLPLSGNAARIEIPVKKEYAPNATVSVYLTRPGGDADLPAERFASAALRVRRPDRELFLAPHLDRAEARPGQNIHGEVLATSEGKPVAAADLAVFAVDDAVLQLGQWTLPDLLATFYPDNPYDIENYQSLARFIDQISDKDTFQKGFVIGDGGDEAAPNITNLRKEFKTLAFWQGSLKTGADGKAVFDFEAPDNLTTYRVIAIGETKASQFGGDASQTVKISKPLMVDPALPRFLRDKDEIELRAVVRQSFADSAAVTVRCITDSGCTLTAEPTLTGTVARNAPLVLRFKAKVTDPDLKPIKVRFEASATSDPSMADAVEITIPVSAPTIVRREAVAGAFTGPSFDAPASMPKDWTQGHGQYSVTLSTSSWLPAIAGIPTILDYPHGCFEQITSKLLCYSLMANLMDYLPDTESRLGAYNTIFQQGIEQIGTSLLSDGRLPYWPGETDGNDFVTCQACWALNEAANAGFDIPEGLTDKLAAAAKKIATDSTDSETRAFALFVLASMKTGDDYSAVAEDIYLHRENMDFDGRAFLAMALHQLNIMPDEKLQLLREIDNVIVPTAFKAATFGSMDRTEGITAMAFESIQPPNFTAAKKAEIRKELLHVLDSASVLSTQENLWLLLAFKSMLDAQPPPALAAAQPPPAASSKNGASAAWSTQKLGEPLALGGLNKAALTFLMQAEYSMPQLDTPRVDRGFRVERVVRNLTDPKRDGSPTAPYRIGDEVLVTYRLFTQKQQYYVALEDSLPAAFETVNPDIAQIGKFFELPPMDPGDIMLDLSHSEMRDQSTLLYFDDLPPGPGVYSILARVTAAGTFRWPATQVTPMYDSRFSGLSASSVCDVSAE